MLINRNTIPLWVAENARLPKKLLGLQPGANFAYMVESAMLEDIKWQEDLELAVDVPLLLERKWYRIWFRRDTYGYFASRRPDSLYERLVLKTRFKCIYRRLQKSGDPRKEFVRIMVRALDY